MQIMTSENTNHPAHTNKDLIFTEVSRSDEKMRIFGILYVSKDKDGGLVEDLCGASIMPETLEDAAYDYVLNARIMGEMHKGETQAPKRFGRLIESFVITEAKMQALNIPKGHCYQCAWWVGYQVEDLDVWEKIKAGEYPDFSLRGLAEMDYHE